MFSFDINFMRVAVTLLSFISFVGIVVWALAKRNQAGFDEAAQLPFRDDRSPSGAPSKTLPAETRDE